MCDTTRQNGGSGETDAQVKILIYHLLMALRGVYKKTGIVDNPVFQILKNICSSVEPAAAHGHERRAGGAGEQSNLHPQLHGEVARGHQAVELGLGEGDTEHRGHSIYLSLLTMGIV